jgi:hypothetical protein
MPAFLMPLLRLFGPSLVSLALKYLEGKYPGIKEVLGQIFEYIKAENNKAQAVDRVKQTLTTTATLPQLKKDA